MLLLYSYKYLAMRDTFLVLLLTNFCFCCFANQQTVGVLVNYHLQQADKPGLGFVFKSHFNDSLALEFSYIQNQDVSVELDSFNVVGAFDTSLLGLAVSRQYNDFVTVNLGAGISYTLNSTNASLIADNSIVPYFKFSTDYRINKHISLSFGQISQFSKNILDTNHSLFLSFNYKFGNITNASDKKTVVHIESISKKTTIAPSINSPTVDMGKESKMKLPPRNKNSWFYQFGAFGNKNNALDVATKLKGLFNDSNNNQLSIIFHNNLYKILSKPFRDKLEAKNWYKVINKRINVSGFVVFISE